MRCVTAEHAIDVCENSVLRRGMSEEHSKWFSHALVKTSLWGIDTHGLRLLPLYLKELDEGRASKNPKLITKLTGAVGTIDADNACGSIAGTYASHVAVSLAREFGVGVVSVRKSNHFGAASVYGDIIAKNGMIGLIMTSAAARMAPFNGTRPFFGTNPICFSAPTIDRPFIFDMATSQISYSQVKHRRAQGLELGAGWALDSNGRPTTDPINVTTLSPLGGYKGQGLAMTVQILSALLAGMPLDTELEHLDTGDFSIGRNIGHFILAIDPARFGNIGNFTTGISDLIAAVRTVPALYGTSVIAPGDPQARQEKTRLANGIPLSSVEVDTFELEANLLNMGTGAKNG